MTFLGLLSSLCLAFTGCGLFLFRCGLLSTFHEVPGTFDEEPALFLEGLTGLIVWVESSNIWVIRVLGIYFYILYTFL